MLFDDDTKIDIFDVTDHSVTLITKITKKPSKDEVIAAFVDYCEDSGFGQSRTLCFSIGGMIRKEISLSLENARVLVKPMPEFDEHGDSVEKFMLHLIIPFVG